MTKSPRSSSAERKARQAKKRERERKLMEAKRSEFEKAAAIYAEQIAEEQAPKAQRHAVMAASGAIVRDPLAERDLKRGGYRRADPLRRMNPNKDQLRAARQFTEDYEWGIEGASRGAAGDRVDGSSASGVAEGRLDAIARYNAACWALGPSLRRVVEAVVLHRVSLSVIAEKLGTIDQRASERVLTGLDRLVDHYWPERTISAPIMPPPLAIDLQVLDIPQERLGRTKSRLTSA